MKGNRIKPMLVLALYVACSFTTILASLCKSPFCFLGLLGLLGGPVIFPSMIFYCYPHIFRITALTGMEIVHLDLLLMSILTAALWVFQAFCLYRYARTKTQAMGNTVLVLWVISPLLAIPFGFMIIFL